MTISQIRLGKNRPRMGRHFHGSQDRVMRQDEFPIGRASNIEFETVNEGGGSQESGKRVAGESGGPALVADHLWDGTR